MESLSIEGHCSSRIMVPDHETVGKNDTHPPHARIFKSPPKNSLAPSFSASEGKSIKGIDEDNKTNIRASPVPRPRAVLSSPDNDGIIGSQNQRLKERRAPLGRQKLNSDGITGQQNQLIREKRKLPKRPALTSNTLAQCKSINSSARVGSPLSTRKVSKEAENNSILKEKHSSELSAPRQRPPFK